MRVQVAGRIRMFMWVGGKVGKWVCVSAGVNADRRVRACVSQNKSRVCEPKLK